MKVVNPTFGFHVVAIYNTELVKPKDVPTRYEDLTDPKWYDKIVMPDPASHATTITWLVGLKESRGFRERSGLDGFRQRTGRQQADVCQILQPDAGPCGKR